MKLSRTRATMFFYIVLSYLIKYFTNTRYSYYLRIKNKDIIVKSKIKYSGSKLRLNIGDFVQYYIFMDGAYEIETLDFVASFIDRKVFFDVGAHIGNYSLSLHKRAKKIYAFEASATNMNYLKKNIRANKIDNIKTIDKAVCNEDNKSIKIYLSPDASSNHSIYDKFKGKYENVETVTLDSFYKKNNIEEIDVIKIDVEGAEFAVIKGASEIFHKFTPLLIVEFSKASADAAGYDLSDLYYYLKDLGYQSFALYNRMLSTINVDAINTDNKFQQNIIFVHGDNLSMIQDSFLLK